MERYAPKLLDLAPRDMIARAIVTEIRNGNGMRGTGNASDFINLDATHLGKAVIDAKLPDIADFCRTYLKHDPAVSPIPIQPTAHYAMGGIPTDVWGRVRADARRKVYEGLYAAGECACVSVHGANRLGTNSLVDLIVFGRRAGKHMADFVSQTGRYAALSRGCADKARVPTVPKLLKGPGKERAIDIRDRMRTIMMDKVGIYRTGKLMKEAVRNLSGSEELLNMVRNRRHRFRFNTELLEALELKNLLDLALVTACCAEHRTESRGAHAREDFPDRNDERFLNIRSHGSREATFTLGSAEVDLSKFTPKPRIY
jgi:succinate dehydrogenase / fumarate reductase flavoprotein subunit